MVEGPKAAGEAGAVVDLPTARNLRTTMGAQNQKMLSLQRKKKSLKKAMPLPWGRLRTEVRVGCPAWVYLGVEEATKGRSGCQTLRLVASRFELAWRLTTRPLTLAIPQRCAALFKLLSFQGAKQKAAVEAVGVLCFAINVETQASKPKRAKTSHGECGEASVGCLPRCNDQEPEEEKPKSKKEKA